MQSSKIVRFIKEFRLTKGLSQAKLAQECGISLRTLQRFESLESVPSMDQFFNIFNYIDPILAKDLSEVFDSHLTKGLLNETFKENLETQSKTHERCLSEDHSEYNLLLELFNKKLKLNDINVRDHGYWELCLEDFTYFWDEYIYELYGFSSENKSELRYKDFLDALVNGQTNKISMKVKKALVDNEPQDSLYEIINCDNQKVQIYCLGFKFLYNSKIYIHGILGEVNS